MPRSRLAIPFLVLLVCYSSAVAHRGDENDAARVLGPQWKQMSRASGMIFAGKILAIEPLPPSAKRPLPLTMVSVRVKHAIAGVQQGQVVKFREWASASSIHRSLRIGQHVLLFLYPPGKLGLTSPANGAAGVLALDAAGKNLAGVQRIPHQRTVSVSQLERAIRHARKE